jgi:hypothetical protein
MESKNELVETEVAEPKKGFMDGGRYVHDKSAPHQAIILIKAEIMEQLETGQVTGLPVKKRSGIVTLIGDTQEECQEKVDAFFTKILNKNEDMIDE